MVLNVQKLCRICINTSDYPRNIFNEKINTEVLIVDFLQKLTNLEIKEEDALPNCVCSQCFSKIIESYELLQLIISSNKTLQDMINNCEQQPLIYEKNNSQVNTQSNDEESNSVMKKDQYTIYHNKVKCARHKKNHVISAFKCFECSQSFTKRLYLKVHQRIHLKTEDKAFTGKLCSKQLLYGHLLKQPEMKAFPCTICDKGCRTSENLRRHMKVHDTSYTKKKHVCEICQKEFLYPSFLIEHMRIHTGEKPHLCPTCGKGFRQSGALHYHQRIHTNYKPFTCTICNGNFMSQSVLKVHMRKHTNERPFICHICGTAFRQSTDLKSHQRTHSGDKPVLCTICGKRMSTTGQLTIHLRSHTGEKPFVCLTCPKAFTTRTMLVKHERIHTGERPYVCDICGKGFSQSSTLKKHTTIHNKNKDGIPKNKNTSNGKKFASNVESNVLYKSPEESEIVAQHFAGQEGVQYTVILPPPVPFTHDL